MLTDPDRLSSDVKTKQKQEKTSDNASCDHKDFIVQTGPSAMCRKKKKTHTKDDL